VNYNDQAIGYGGIWVVGRLNADTADTMQVRDVAMAIISWLSMGYNFSCVIARDMVFDSRGGFSEKLSNEDSQDRVSKGRCMGNNFETTLAELPTF